MQNRQAKWVPQLIRPTLTPSCICTICFPPSSFTIYQPSYQGQEETSSLLPVVWVFTHGFSLKGEVKLVQLLHYLIAFHFKNSPQLNELHWAIIDFNDNESRLVGTNKQFKVRDKRINRWTGWIIVWRPWFIGIADFAQPDEYVVCTTNVMYQKSDIWKLTGQMLLPFLFVHIQYKLQAGHKASAILHW